MISDMTGRKIETRTIAENNGQPQVFNLNNVAPGIYMVKVNAGGKTHITKLVIQ